MFLKCVLRPFFACRKSILILDVYITECVIEKCGFSNILLISGLFSICMQWLSEETGDVLVNIGALSGLYIAFVQDNRLCMVSFA